MTTMKTLHTCTCDFCGSQFESRQTNSHVCKQASCRRAYKRAVEKKYVASMSEEKKARVRERKRLYEKGRRRYKYEPRACAMCGTMFTPRNSLNVNCSRLCTQRSHHAKADARDEKLMAFRASRERSCAVCGAAFTARVNRQRTCSRDCSYQLRLNRQNNHRATTREQRQAARNRPCAHCGKQFQAQTSRQIACSLKCRRSLRRSQQFGQSSQKNYSYPHTCAICGTAFTGASNAKFCSDACRRTNHNRTYGGGLVDHPEKQCVQCGRRFKAHWRHQLTCTKECARLRQLAIKSRNYKEAYARDAANRAAIREERERQRALRSPIKKKKSFVVSSTLTCPACGGQIARADAVLGCCTQTCADALVERRGVKSITDRVAVGVRVLVSHYSRMTIGDVERLVGTSDAGEIIDIADGIARIRHPGGMLECTVGEIGTTETSVQAVKRRIEANTNWRERYRGYKVKYGVEA